MSRPRPWDGRSPVCFWFFTKSIFELTIDISMRKMISEVEYVIKSIIYQILKLFQKNRPIHPEMILRPLLCFKDAKNTDLLPPQGFRPEGEIPRRHSSNSRVY